MASFSKRSSSKKTFKKYARKARGALIKRYFKKGYTPKVGRIMKDVAILKKALNTEKKRVESSQGVGVSFAQFAGASSGNYAVDITPVISQGATGSTRNGLSVKLTSCCLDIQVNQSTNTVNEFRYRWFIVCRPDASLATTAAVAITQFFENNLFSGVIDYHSNRDPEYFHQFRVLKSGIGKLTSDQLASQTSYNQWKVPMKLSHHLKYNTDVSTTTVKNQLFLFLVADSGDVTGLTGAQIRYNVRYYYVDN